MPCPNLPRQEGKEKYYLTSALAILDKIIFFSELVNVNATIYTKRAVSILHTIVVNLLSYKTRFNF